MTKVPEDAAYSLVGIFGVTLPMLYADGAWKRRKQAALDELDLAIERASSRNEKPKDVIRVGGASYEDLRTLLPAQLEHLERSLDDYVEWLDSKISIPEDMTSEELLESRLAEGNGYSRLQVEEKMQALLKFFDIAYEFEVHYNQPEPFDIHRAAPFDKLRWLEDAWHIFGYTAARTVLDLKISIEIRKSQ